MLILTVLPCSVQTRIVEAARVLMFAVEAERVEVIKEDPVAVEK